MQQEKSTDALLSHAVTLLHTGMVLTERKQEILEELHTLLEENKLLAEALEQTYDSTCLLLKELKQYYSLKV